MTTMIESTGLDVHAAGVAHLVAAMAVLLVASELVRFLAEGR